MIPSQILSDEHKNILFMLDILKRKILELNNSNMPSPDELTSIVNFLRYYADRYHHGKEEDILFPKYEAVGIPVQGPIGIMLDEHVIGREYIKKMLDAIEGMNTDHDTKQDFIANAQQYVSLLQEHIFKEENILYPMGDSKLNQTDFLEVTQKFDEYEKKRFDLIPELEVTLKTLYQYKKG